jgi:hypothetical protein
LPTKKKDKSNFLSLKKFNFLKNFKKLNFLIFKKFKVILFYFFNFVLYHFTTIPNLTPNSADAQSNQARSLHVWNRHGRAETLRVARLPQDSEVLRTFRAEGIDEAGRSQGPSAGAAGQV